MGECEAQRDGGRRFAGLSGLEKQASRDGASAEQGSSFKAEKEKDTVTQADNALLGRLSPHTSQQARVKCNGPGVTSKCSSVPGENNFKWQVTSSTRMINDTVMGAYQIMIKIWRRHEMGMFTQHLQNWAGASGWWGKPQATWS